MSKKNMKKSTVSQSDLDQAAKLLQNNELDTAKKRLNNILKKSPNHESALHYLALVQFKQGKYYKAKENLETSISIKPTSLKHYTMGQVLEKTQDIEEAETNYRLALSYNSNDIKALNNLGTLLREQRKFEEAESILQQAISLDTSHVKSRLNLGNVYFDLKYYDKTCEQYEQALHLAPDYLEAIYNYGEILENIHRYENAEKLYLSTLENIYDHKLIDKLINLLILQEKCLSALDILKNYNLLNNYEFATRTLNCFFQLQTPQYLTDIIDTHWPDNSYILTYFAKYLLNEYCIEDGQIQTTQDAENSIKDYSEIIDLAKDYLFHSLELNDSDPDCYYYLGYIFQLQADIENSEYYYQKAANLDSNYLDGMSEVVNLKLRFLYIEKAIDLAHTIISDKYNPQEAKIYEQLSKTMSQYGYLHQAYEITKRGLEKFHNSYQLYLTIGNIMADSRHYEEAIYYFDQAEKIIGTSSNIIHNKIFTKHYQIDTTKQELYNIITDWGKDHLCSSDNYFHHYNRFDPEKKLRIGILGKNLRCNPTGFFSISAYEALSNHHIELYAYNNTQQQDDITNRFYSICKQLRSIKNQSYRQIAEQINKDRIDILIDHTGHASECLLYVMTCKPAPVQIKWVGGQFNTTGLDAIDYFLTDWQETPYGEDKWYTETLIRMPDAYVCYSPPQDPPKATMLPALKNGYITFGSFNKPNKMNEQVISLWAGILNAIPNSKIFIKFSTLNEKESKELLYDSFAKQGIGRDRIIIEGHSNRENLLKTYNYVDIALDTFPYSGGLTTCESLLMGVPVITKPGSTFAGRHSYTHLYNAGLQDWIAHSEEEYINLAKYWSQNLGLLSVLRHKLRDQLLNSPLCDAERFASNFYQKLREVWEAKCEEMQNQQEAN